MASCSQGPPGAARSAQLPATHGSVVHCSTGPAGGLMRPLLGGRRVGPHTPPLWWASGSRVGSASRPASSSRQCTWMSTSFLGKWCWGPCKTVCEAIPSQTAKCRRKQSPRLSRRLWTQIRSPAQSASRHSRRTTRPSRVLPDWAS